MGAPPISFTGFSKYSDSFQEILQKTFDAASLPIKRLQTEQDALTDRQKALGELSSSLSSLQSSFRDLALAAGNGALSGASSNESVATVSVTGLPEKLSFDLDVTSAASQAQEASLNALGDNNSGSLSTVGDGQFTLTVGATVTNIGLQTIGSGRTAGTTGAATPSPPVSVQVDFSNGLSGSITADLNSFFVAAAPPSTIGAGNTITVNFVSDDLSINQSIQAVPLTGSETTADIATLLNDQIALDPELNGKVSFSDEGGNLKLIVSDTAGQGFSFTSSSSGTTVSGLEAGGTVGGHSAEEIAAALNAEIALNPTLSAAGVTFSAVNGQVKVSGNTTFDIAVTDNAQGTGFASGLAGSHSVGEFDDTLEGLEDYINTNSATLGVKATLINTSSNPASPAYRLTLTATATGASTLRLQESDGTDLLTNNNQGTNAVFEVNGVEIDNTSNTIVDFLPGLNLTIVGPGTATITTATNGSGLSKALADITDAYNSTVETLHKQIGRNAGPLGGSVEVRQAEQTLRQITSFFSTEGLNSMRELGLNLEKTGQLTFNPLAFGFLNGEQLQGALGFIGDLGSGFAGNATTLLGNLTSPVNGQIQTALDFLDESEGTLDDKILKEQDRVNQLIATLELRFAAADLLVSQLDAQKNMLTAFLDAQKTAAGN